MAEQPTASMTTATSQKSKSALTTELVQKVTDRVYALMMQDLKINRERRQALSRKR